MFGLELEGLSHEDREFEVAKQFVKLATDAAQNAAAPPPGASPAQVAQKALTEAAKKFAPGLLGGGGNGAGLAAGGHHHGRWIRKGHKIVLYGV